MHTHAAAITTVAPERIAEELRKLLQAGAFAGLWSCMKWACSCIFCPNSLASRTVQRLPGRCDAWMPYNSVRPSYRGHLDLLLAALLCDSGLSSVTQTGTSWTLQDLAQASARLARQRLEALKITTIGATPAHQRADRPERF